MGDRPHPTFLVTQDAVKFSCFTPACCTGSLMGMHLQVYTPSGDQTHIRRSTCSAPEPQHPIVGCLRSTRLVSLPFYNTFAAQRPSTGSAGLYFTISFDDPPPSVWAAVMTIVQTLSPCLPSGDTLQVASRWRESNLSQHHRPVFEEKLMAA
jgi:hypothetical protein